MPRLMSVAFTETAVVERRKIAARRLSQGVLDFGGEAS